MLCSFAVFLFFFKQKHAYEMRIRDWSSDVCSSDLLIRELGTVEFSMRELAARAHISHYTSYNLIGNKGTVLYTLLHRAIDRITNLPSQADPNFDPLSYAFDMGDLAVEFYVSD